MYSFTGKVVTKERLQSNYLSLVIQRQQDGLLGSHVHVLVPTLVEVRDGAPQVGSVVEIEAQPPQAADLAAGLSGFDFVVNRLTPPPAGYADTGGPSSVVALHAPGPGKALATR